MAGAHGLCSILVRYWTKSTLSPSLCHTAKPEIPNSGGTLYGPSKNSIITQRHRPPTTTNSLPFKLSKWYVQNDLMCRRKRGVEFRGCSERPPTKNGGENPRWTTISTPNVQTSYKLHNCSKATPNTHTHVQTRCALKYPAPAIVFRLDKMGQGSSHEHEVAKANRSLAFRSTFPRPVRPTARARLAASTPSTRSPSTRLARSVHARKIRADTTWMICDGFPNM